MAIYCVARHVRKMGSEVVTLSAYPPQYGTPIGPYGTYIPSLNAKTIIIVNADIGQSLTDAQTYCSTRGIPTANIRSVHFGLYNYPTLLAGLQNPANPAYMMTIDGSPGGSITTAGTYNGISAGSALLPMIANEITNYGCLCVLFSTYTPCNYVGTVHGSGIETNGAYCLPAIAGAAVTTATISNLYVDAALGTYTLPGYGLSAATSLAGFQANYVPTNWASLTTMRPHGRLGCPDLTQMNISPYVLAELPLSSGTTTVFQNAVTQAHTCEATNQVTLPIYYSSQDLPAFGEAGQNTAYAALIAQQAFTTSVDMLLQGTSGTLGYSFMTTNPCTTPLPNFGSILMLAGLNSVGGVYQYTTGSLCPWNGNYTLATGAFGGCYASYSYNFGMNLLYSGAVAAIMTVGEPYANNIAYGSEIFNVLVNQRTPIALALFWSPGGDGANTAIIGQTVFGDPLYQPFKNTFPSGYKITRGLISGGGGIGVS